MPKVFGFLQSPSAFLIYNVRSCKINYIKKGKLLQNKKANYFMARRSVTWTGKFRVNMCICINWARSFLVAQTLLGWHYFFPCLMVLVWQFPSPKITSETGTLEHNILTGFLTNCWRGISYSCLKTNILENQFETDLFPFSPGHQKWILLHFYFFIHLFVFVNLVNTII